MKSKILTSLLIVISTLSYSQDYLDDIALKTCECLNTIADSLETERFNMELGLCMIDAAAPYKKQLKKDHKIDLNKIDTQGEELGRIVGLKMATVCPDALLAMVNKVKNKEDTDISESIIEGYVTRIEQDKFVVFSIKDENGKTTKFYWLTFIETDFNFEFTTQYKSLMNETVRIAFISQDYFDFRIEEYRTFNIIQKIEILP